MIFQLQLELCQMELFHKIIKIHQSEQQIIFYEECFSLRVFASLFQLQFVSEFRDKQQQKLNNVKKLKQEFDYNFLLVNQLLMALKKLRFPLLLIILVSICQQQSAKEILIDYEFKLEKPIRNFYLKYFYDIKDKYFVDAGAFDPTHKSTTANLVAQGWNGIFIEASPQRSRRFMQQRQEHVILNIALGRKDKFIKLFDGSRGSVATVIPQAKKKKKNVKFNKNIVITELSMKQICERFFLRKISYFSLDIEGYGAQALANNDWNNPLCRPELISVEQNILNDLLKDIPTLDETLTKNGYVKIDHIEENSIYVEKELKAHFLKKREEGLKWLAKRRIIYFLRIYKNIGNHLGTDLNIDLTRKKLYYFEASRDPFYFYQATGAPIYINEVNKRSNQLGELHNKTDRPIIIYHYNPSQNGIFVTDPEYTLSSFQVNDVERYYNLTTRNAQNKTLYVYIFDHRFSPALEPLVRVVGMENECKLENKQILKNQNDEKSAKNEDQEKEEEEEEENQESEIKELKSENVKSLDLWIMFFVLWLTNMLGFGCLCKKTQYRGREQKKFVQNVTLQDLKSEERVVENDNQGD